MEQSNAHFLEQQHPQFDIIVVSALLMLGCLSKDFSPSL
jgi:hypothetical protein